MTGHTRAGIAATAASLPQPTSSRPVNSRMAAADRRAGQPAPGHLASDRLYVLDPSAGIPATGARQIKSSASAFTAGTCHPQQPHAGADIAQNAESARIPHFWPSVARLAHISRFGAVSHKLPAGRGILSRISPLELRRGARGRKRPAAFIDESGSGSCLTGCSLADGTRLTGFSAQRLAYS